MAALEPAGGASWTPLVGESGPRRFCANAGYHVCNWLTTAERQDRLCVACRHNDTIPDISQASHLTAWRDIELAKHRLFYSLLRWKLPLKTRAEDPNHGLAFEFLADPPHPSGSKVMTGHDDGVVTIALAEADSAEIERRRAELAEPYRSLLGHFRHEVGHHYWDILVRDGGKLEQCRAVRPAFGEILDPYAEGSIERIVDAWAPFVVAMNSVNRAMGRSDLYPFVIAPAVVQKLRFIHDLVRGAAHSAVSAPARKPLESAVS